MRKLNNKGYLLVEIIVAFSLAMAFLYIISDITIRVKNKNDDLKVRMLATVDQTVIYNMIMSEAYHYDKDDKNINFNGTRCLLGVSSNKFTYQSKNFFVSDYVTLSNSSCSSKIVKLNVKNFPSGTFDVVPHTVNIKKYLKK